MNNSYSHIIVNYDEIILKGKNRPYFERALVSNIKEFLQEATHRRISKEGGRLIIEIDEKSDISEIGDILKNIPGISNFSFASIEENDIEKICMKTLQLLNGDRKLNEYKTFKISARRSDKSFVLNSPQINAKVGEFIFENTNLKVDVHSPDLDITVNVGNKGTFIYFEKTKGVGGLPVGTAGNLVSLLSGGIDSPVASFMMMKRGAKISFVHFKSRTMGGSSEGIDKIKSLVKILCKFQGSSRLYIIPFEDFQKEIITNVLSKNRMIVYRRIMLKMAEMIAQREQAKGVIVGDSLSQVASQTLENLGVVYNAIDLPIFPPLIGMNKQETIDLANKIGTYDTSIIPYPDCCSFIASNHPETKAKIEEIKEQESGIAVDDIMERILSEIKPEIISL